jgi:hypothetical protein
MREIKREELLLYGSYLSSPMNKIQINIFVHQIPSKGNVCLSVTTLSFLKQRKKSVVKPTDKSIRKTIFGWLEHKPNFMLAQQILFFYVWESF